MRLLLDTHALIWYNEADPRLSEKARSAIRNENGDNELAVSIVSFWEMAIKLGIKKDKIPLRKTLPELYQDTQRMKAELLTVQPNHAYAVQTLPQYEKHRDPFDRMLIVQAMLEDFTVVTHDEKFPLYPVKILW